MTKQRKTYPRARRCKLTGEKLAGVDREFLNFEGDALDLVSIVEETGDLTLVREIDYERNSIGGTIVIGNRDFAAQARVTAKYLSGTLLPNSDYHSYQVPVGRTKFVSVSHQNSVDAGNCRRSRWRLI